MKLPQGDNAYILKEKLTDYILSETHATGKFKAKLFRKFGFNDENIDVFIKALIKIAKTEKIVNLYVFEFGTKYIVDGKIKTPIGKIVSVRTVWVIEKSKTRPRFVTVYPL